MSPRRAASVAVAALLAMALVACSQTKEVTGAPTTTGSTTEPAPPPTNEIDCPVLPMGSILPARLAEVTFTTERVCPGYVTVLPRTPVRWVNADTAPHTLVITEGNGPDGALVHKTTIEPGGTASYTFDTEGVWAFTTDALPSFRGVVEATLTGGHQHG